jgi:hypothetical protein
MPSQLLCDNGPLFCFVMQMLSLALILRSTLETITLPRRMQSLSHLKATFHAVIYGSPLPLNIVMKALVQRGHIPPVVYAALITLASHWHGSTPFVDLG